MINYFLCEQISMSSQRWSSELITFEANIPQLLQKGTTTPYTIRTELVPRFSSNVANTIELRKIILLNVQKMEPIIVECSLIKSTPTNPISSFGVFYQQMAKSGDHVCIINQNPLRMSMASTQAWYDVAWTRIIGIKEQLQCTGVIIECVISRACE